MQRPIRRTVVRYSGNVQGVGFRMTAIRLADGLRIDGTVRNEPDGSVLMDIEGPDDDIRELMRRIAVAMEENITGTATESREPTDSREPTGKSTGFSISH